MKYKILLAAAALLILWLLAASLKWIALLALISTTLLIAWTVRDRR